MNFQLHFHNTGASYFVPDGSKNALERVTHLGIGAHQDDLEFMAFHGIANCYHSTEEWFGGVICADGCGSVLTGPYEHLSRQELAQLRAKEQESAAIIGRYGFVIQLSYASMLLRSEESQNLVNDLFQILMATQPQVVYTHNPADKHTTHVAVCVAALLAMRQMPPQNRPKTVYGCEVWRGLDWLCDDEKVVLDVSALEHISAALSGLYDTQISGSAKRYDLAIQGRRRANATFLDPHSKDCYKSAALAMDLTPLITNDSSDIENYVCEHIRRFENDVRQKLKSQLSLQNSS